MLSYFTSYNLFLFLVAPWVDEAPHRPINNVVLLVCSILSRHISEDPCIPSTQLEKSPEVLDAQVERWKRVNMPGPGGPCEHQDAFDRSSTGATLVLGEPTPGEIAFRAGVDRPLKDVLFPNGKQTWSQEFVRSDCKVWLERREELGDVQKIDPDLADPVQLVLEKGMALNKLRDEVEPLQGEIAHAKSKLANTVSAMKDLQYHSWKLSNPTVDPATSEKLKAKIDRINEWHDHKVLDETKKLDTFLHMLKGHEAQYVELLDSLIGTARSLLKTDVETPASASENPLMDELASFLGDSLQVGDMTKSSNIKLLVLAIGSFFGVPSSGICTHDPGPVQVLSPAPSVVPSPSVISARSPEELASDQEVKMFTADTCPNDVLPNSKGAP